MLRRSYGVFSLPWLMKRMVFPIIALCIWLIGTALAAEYYKVSGVKRVDQDLYKTSSDLYIETKYCYHYTYGEDALLKWEGKNGANKIVWDDDSTCDVKDIWKK